MDYCVPIGAGTSGDGDGDGDASTGDGDGDTSTGDGDGDTATGDGDGDTATGDGDGDTTGPSGGPPMIVDFGTNVTSITEGESVVFTATVIDPDGPDDVQGGSLKSQDGAINYGGFADQGNGTYSIEISWSQINQTDTLEFDGMETRTFRAEFFDNMANSASEMTDIDFTCAGGCAWDGTCPDTQNDDDHCGTCGHACTVIWDDGHCAAGACGPTYSECAVMADPPVNCTQVCGARGQACSEDGCGDGGVHVVWFSDQGQCENLNAASGGVYLTCTTAPTSVVGAVGVTNYRCCCEQG
jgi:hypothetical protein